MNQKYYNDAIIGNKNIRATFSKKGELLRLYYPSVDFKQFLDFYRVGVKINDSGIIYLHDDINNRYNQYYTENTNILNTEIENTYFNLQIKQTDFVSIKENVLIRKYVLKNNNKLDLNINFLIDSKLLTDENNMVSGKVVDNGLIQYSHDNILITLSNTKINGHRINNVQEYINSGILEDKDYIGMSEESAISYNIGEIKSGEEKNFVIYILINDKIKSPVDLENEIEKAKKIDADKEYNSAKRYWNKYVSAHTNLELKEFEKIYTRTILLFPLLTNSETGGIAAAMEVDENRENSGRYSYCWPRDAVFVTRAMDELKMNEETEKFYKVFCKNTQRTDGMWEQRFYTDGRLAPCWGYQIDETASVVYGVYEHYKIKQDEKFLTANLKMCENATKALLKYLSVVFEEKEEEDIVKKEIEDWAKEEGRQTDKLYKHVSYDLWEMNEGVHLYSLAAIYASFEAMEKMYDIVKPKYENNRLKLEQISKLLKKIEGEKEKIKKYIAKNMYDENTKTLKRNCEDSRMDISIIGAVEPFAVFQPEEKKIKNTVERINMTLRTYTGGYIRFEEDSYMQGHNPWPIATLWMALYYIKIGSKNKAKECIDFVTQSANHLGFIAEQVDNSTLEPKWVIGLGWAHAMYIIAITEYNKKFNTK